MSSAACATASRDCGRPSGAGHPCHRAWDFRAPGRRSQRRCGGRRSPCSRAVGPPDPLDNGMDSRNGTAAAVLVAVVGLLLSGLCNGSSSLRAGLRGELDEEVGRGREAWRDVLLNRDHAVPPGGSRRRLRPAVGTGPFVVCAHPQSASTVGGEADGWVPGVGRPTGCGCRPARVTRRSPTGPPRPGGSGLEYRDYLHVQLVPSVLFPRIKGAGDRQGVRFSLTCTGRSYLTCMHSHPSYIETCPICNTRILGAVETPSRKRLGLASTGPSRASHATVRWPTTARPPRPSGILKRQELFTLRKFQNCVLARDGFHGVPNASQVICHF